MFFLQVQAFEDQLLLKSFHDSITLKLLPQEIK